MKISMLLFLLLLALLQYRLWVGHGSMPEVRDLEKQTSQLQQENENLKERNLSLAAEVLDLQHGQEAIEEYARSEMGMIKHAETFYQIIDDSGTDNNSNIN